MVLKNGSPVGGPPNNASSESLHVTNFSSHLGLRRYKRLNFGISSTAEVFQDLIQEVLTGLAGVLNVSDDVLVHAPTLDEHLLCHKAVFQ